MQEAGAAGPAPGRARSQPLPPDGPVVSRDRAGFDEFFALVVSAGRHDVRLASLRHQRGWPTGGRDAPLCLDVTDGHNDNRVPLQVWACTSTQGMNWRIVYAGRFGYQIYYNVQTKVGDRCMDVPARSLVDGEQLQTYGCSAGITSPAQLWSGLPRYDY